MTRDEFDKGRRETLGKRPCSKCDQPVYYDDKDLCYLHDKEKKGMLEIDRGYGDE